MKILQVNLADQATVQVILDNDIFQKYHKNIKVCFNRSVFVVYVVNNKTRKIKALHRILTNCPKNKFVDHINGNGLDNRRKNLRVCTFLENVRNTKNREGSLSKYKGVRGVYYNGKRVSNKWRASITVNGKYIHLGTFNNEITAAKLYNKSAKKYFGKFARLNEV